MKISLDSRGATRFDDDDGPFLDMGNADDTAAVRRTRTLGVRVWGAGACWSTAAEGGPWGRTVTATRCVKPARVLAAHFRTAWMGRNRRDAEDVDGTGTRILLSPLVVACWADTKNGANKIATARNKVVRDIVDKFLELRDCVLNRIEAVFCGHKERKLPGSRQSAIRLTYYDSNSWCRLQPRPALHDQSVHATHHPPVVFIRE